MNKIIEVHQSAEFSKFAKKTIYWPVNDAAMALSRIADRNYHGEYYLLQSDLALATELGLEIKVTEEKER